MPFQIKVISIISQKNLCFLFLLAEFLDRENLMAVVKIQLCNVINKNRDILFFNDFESQIREQFEICEKSSGSMLIWLIIWVTVNFYTEKRQRLTIIKI